MQCARKTRINASSVSLFPRERMRDITSLRLALVKTSGMETGEPQRHQAHKDTPTFVSFVASWLESIICPFFSLENQLHRTKRPA